MRTTKGKPFFSPNTGCGSAFTQMTASASSTQSAISLSNLLLSIALLPAIIILVNIIIL